MDITAHRNLKRARDLLVETFNVGLLGVGAPTFPHGISSAQAVEIDKVAWQLFALMNDDPAPPECQTCATPLEQKPMGRPARYCSDTCRSRDRV